MARQTTTIPKGWKMTTLGEVADRIGDGLHGTPKYSNNGEYYFINGNNIEDGKIVIKDDTKKIGKGEFEKYKKDLGENTILLSINGTIGSLAKYKNEKCILGKSVAYINVSNKNSLDFVYYLTLDSRFQRDISKNANGSTIKNVSLAQLRNYSFNLPPLPEQRAIGTMLSSLDNKIELLREQNIALEATAQAIFKEWFVKFRFPGYEKIKMIDSELGEIPDGWRIEKLGELVNLTIGRTPPRKEPKWFSVNPKDVKWLSIKDLGNAETYVSGTSEYLTKEAIQTHKIKIVPVNTVLISFKLTVGRVAITLEEMVTNEAIAHLRPLEKSILDTEYLYLYFKTFDFNLIGSTSSIATAFNSESLRTISILVPERNVLKNFIEATKPIFKKIASSTHQIQTLSALRDTLLSKLMKGQIRVRRFHN